MRTLARVLRAVADVLSPAEPEEGVRVLCDVPGEHLWPVVEASTKAFRERTWPCRGCGELQVVDNSFVLSPDTPKRVRCARCCAP